MKKLLPLICLCLASFVWAGNRADVNADGVVNAADLALLGNVVAGNLDIGNYDLANVVVVAPQGGDFTSPLAAVNWVATQSPSATKRFLVLVTPGEYHYSGQFMLPSYTTLCGYGPSNTRLIQDGANYEGVYAYEVIDVAVANLQIEAKVLGVTAQASFNVRLEHVVVSVDGDIGYDIWGVVCRSTNMEIVDCEIRATQRLTNYAGYALFLPYVEAEVQPYVRVRNSILSGGAVTQGKGYYHGKNSGSWGWALLFHCILVGDTNSVTQLVRFACCDQNGNPEP
jgi:hypothetical protein